MSCLPVPVSPRIRTVESVGATVSAVSAPPRYFPTNRQIGIHRQAQHAEFERDGRRSCRGGIYYGYAPVCASTAAVHPPTAAPGDPDVLRGRPRVCEMRMLSRSPSPHPGPLPKGEKDVNQTASE